MQNVINSIQDLSGTVLILTHHNADMDAIASALALQLGLKQKGINSSVGVSESVSKVAKNLTENRKIIIDPDCSNFNKVILVDTSVPEQVSSVKNLKIDILIDHHPPNKLVETAVASYVDEAAKSSAQIIFKILTQLECTIDKEIAEILLAGLVADTAHLRLAEKKEFEVIVKLLDTGIRYKNIISLLQTPIDISEKIACLKAAARSKNYRMGNLIISVSKVISFEAAACRALLRIGADIAIVVAKKEKEIRISSRGKHIIKEKEINLGQILKKVGQVIGGNGGGHDLAGSANGPDKDKAKQATDMILKEISEKLGKEINRI